MKNDGHEPALIGLGILQREIMVVLLRSFQMLETEIKQILDLIESSREALDYLYHTNSPMEKGAMRGIISEAIKAIFNLLSKYHLGGSFDHEKFILSLNEESPSQASRILDETEA